MAEIVFHLDLILARPDRRPALLRRLRAFVRLARLRRHAHEGDRALARSVHQTDTDRWLSLYLRSHF